MLISKPTKNSSKRFPFKIKFTEKQSLLAIHEKENLSNNIEFIDVLIPMLYTDSEQNIDIRNFLRTLLFSIAQKYTNEEIKEILTCRTLEHFETSHFLSTGDSKEGKRYMDLVRFLAEDNNVQGTIVGTGGLFQDKEDYEKDFLQNIKQPSHEEKNENSQDKGEKNNEKTPEESLAQDTSVAKNITNTFYDNVDESEISSLSRAFISSILQAGEYGEINKEDINNYICTMLHGIGLVIPTISADEAKKMMEELQLFIDQKIEYILKRNIEYFDRKEE